MIFRKPDVSLGVLMGLLNYLKMCDV
jgi:hypothetical protein